MQNKQEKQDNCKEESNGSNFLENIAKTEAGQALLLSIANFINKKGDAPTVDNAPTVERRLSFEERRMQLWYFNRRVHFLTHTGLIAILFIVLSILVFTKCVSETIYATLISSLIGYIFGQIKSREKTNTDAQNGQ